MILDLINKAQKALKDYTIITDDGHGWFTQGKRSYTDPQYFENEFNSALEAKLLFLLDICGIKYFQLAPGHIDTELKDRGKLEHQIYDSSDNKKIIGVSIHCDAWENPNDKGKQNDANGFCVYYYPNSEKGKLIARHVASSIIVHDKQLGTLVTPRHNKGIESANFYILRETKAPWILIENAFMTNDRDLNYLRNDYFKNNRAVAILDGLCNYVLSVNS